MADGDDVYIPVLRTLGDLRGDSLYSLNEIIRQAFTRLAYLEGRLGEVQVRDDLDVVGELTVDSKVGVGTAAPSASLDVEGKVTIDSNGRQLFNATPSYNLANNSFSPTLALDPGGRAGDASYGGEIAVPSGKVLALINLSGTTITPPTGALTAETHLDGLRFVMKNSAMGGLNNSRVRPIIGSSTLDSDGSTRTAHLRADATASATGFINSLNCEIVPGASTSIARGIQLTAEGTSGLIHGIYMDAAGGTIYDTGIVFPATFDATNAAINLRTGGATSRAGLIRWDQAYINNAADSVMNIGRLDGNLVTFRLDGPNGSYIEQGWNTELLTLSLVAAATDTSANLLPSRSVILAVCTFVTQAITGAGITDYSIGNPTTATLYAAVEAGLTAGSSRVAHNQWNTAANAATTGPFSPLAAAPVRITTNGGIATAGQVRIAVFYQKASPPTS